jgi:hypothetical protein
MPFYFYRGGYTARSWGNLIAQPQDLVEAMRPSVERFGGKIVACFIALNGSGAEPHGFIEFPDNAAAMAWGVLLEAQGILREAVVYPVLSAPEGLEALRRIGQTGPTDTHGW